MLNSITYSLPGEIEDKVRQELAAWQAENKISRIWGRDASVWTGDDEASWLGWLEIVTHEMENIEIFRAFAEDVRSADFKDVLLMGMGGSSLCPEVLGMTFGKDHFHILDSTVPARIRAIEEKLDIANTLFIVASKSGSTLEPNCFKQYFFDKVSGIAGKAKAGRQFVAITDPGSKMQKVAEADAFRQIFFGDPEIGGRFSALSAFGLAAAASMGLDVELLLDRAGEMASACRTEAPAENPGALLGTILGICQKNGRDKLTITASAEIYDLGAWLEQLIAESTGKNGIAIIPVDREPLQPADAYSNDRVFVHLSVKGAAQTDSDYETLSEIERSGHPFINVEMESAYHIGQEFFRWEFATAVAGSIMGINPFNQPDVESAKIEARKLTDEYERAGSLPDEKPFYEEAGIKLFSSDEYSAELTGAIDDRSLAHYLEAHLLNIEEHDYFALLAYVEMSQENESQLQAIRQKVLEQNGVATCLGFGPRFLHSTGQAYKGGGNNGVFLQITSEDEFDIDVPGQKYSFGIVKAAQARGDFEVLLDRGRRALRVHLTADVIGGLQVLARAIDHSGDVSL
jgi:transaldolase/glucose-6-phosphate isomerase